MGKSKAPRIGVTNIGFSDEFVTFVLIAGLAVGGFVGFAMPEKERRAVINQVTASARTAWDQINKMISGKAAYATSYYTQPTVAYVGYQPLY